MFPTISTRQTWQRPLGIKCSSSSKHASSVVTALQETLRVSLHQHANHGVHLLASSNAVHLFLHVHTFWQAQTAFCYAQTQALRRTVRNIHNWAVKPVCVVPSWYVQCQLKSSAR